MIKDFKEWRDQYTLSTIQADHETIVHAAFDAGYDAASVGLSLSYLAERNFCQRCGKRLMSALGPVSLHTCCPPQSPPFPVPQSFRESVSQQMGVPMTPRTFDDYGNKIV